MSDADELQALLEQAAGTRCPSSIDVSPIIALIEQGYDLDREIIPGIRNGAASARQAVSSWRYFIPAIKRMRMKTAPASTGKETTLEGDLADGPRPVQWIRGNDPRYGSLAAQWADEKKQRRPAPIASKYFKGLGWPFPTAWVGRQG